MSRTHTPGPWTTRCTANRTHPYAIIGSGFNLAQVENIDDARLIAAAPDMLAAGQAMVNDYQTSAEHHPDHVLITRTAFEAMRAAITKATEPTT